MIKIFFYMVIFSTLSACGVSLQKAQQLDIHVSDINRGEMIPFESVKSFENCESIEGSQSLGAKIFANGKYQSEEFIYDINLFSQVTYAGKYDYLKSSVRPLKNGITLTENPDLFIPCLGHDYSQSKTYEAAVVSTLYSFTGVARELKQAGIILPPIKLVIAPEMTEIIESKNGRSVIQEKSTLLNNAYYNYNGQEIIFLPQGLSVSGQVPYNGVPMWQIPFVGIHEYGHHLFSTLIPRFIEDQEKGTDSFLFKPKTRDVDLSSIFTVINEAYADLFAGIIIDGKQNLTGLGCIEKTRDIHSQFFLNGTRKLISEDVLREFFSDNQNPDGVICNLYVNFQDPHNLGSIIAHMLFTGMESLDLSKAHRLAFLKNWADEINKQYFNIKRKNNRRKLLELTKIATDILQNSYGLPTSRFCMLANRYFPMLGEYSSCK